MKLHYTRKQMSNPRFVQDILRTTQRVAEDWVTQDTEIERLRGEVKKAHHEGCCDGLEMCCHSDTWDESEAKRAITIPEGE